MLKFLRKVFAPEPHKPRLPEDEIKRQYPGKRWRILEATFIGYASYYLLRDNIKLATSEMEVALSYSKEQLGTIMGVTAIAYGLGKFFMGALSDRSNPRVFIVVGLLLSTIFNFLFGAAGDVNFSLGGKEFHIAVYDIHLYLWALNGVVQGMGWPPCGRSMGHWFSENERGFTFSIWNTSHNVGGAIIGIIAAEAVKRFGGWEYAFYVPGAITAIMCVYLFFRMMDTPQSQGLPPIEEYRNDYSKKSMNQESHERELTFKELFFDYVLFNKFVWILAIANFFAYITRYSMLDWGPTYLREAKGVSITKGSFAVVAIEVGGIPSTILLGYLSDKLGGRRGRIAVYCMIPIIVAYALLPFVPANDYALAIDLFLMFIVGLFIYPVINFITIMALDLTSKKAIGIAAGFIGLFGYIGKAANSWMSGKLVDDLTPVVGSSQAWNAPLYLATASGIIAAGCLMLTWKHKA